MVKSDKGVNPIENYKYKKKNCGKCLIVDQDVHNSISILLLGIVAYCGREL
jgi:hypothetical protein